MARDDLKATFFAECEDLLDQLSEGTQALVDGTAEDETVHAVFRAVHSIKGAAGAFGLDTLVTFAHSLETVLDRLRSGDLVLDTDALHTILRSGDMLADLVELARDESDEVPDAMPAILEKLADLSGCPEPDLAIGDAADGEENFFGFAPLALGPIDLDEPSPSECVGYRIRFAAVEDLFRNGHDPVLIFSELGTLGEMETRCELEGLPEAAAFDPDRCYLAWEITLRGDLEEEAIREVLTFVEDFCEIEPLFTDSPETGVEALPTGGIVLPFDTASEAGSDPAPEATAEPEPAFVAAPSTPEPKPAPSAAPDEPGKQKVAAKPAGSMHQTTLRVDPDRVDRLINTVGELIINQAVIAQKLIESGVANNSDIMGDLDDYQYLARELQEGVMAIRAQPVKPLFQRMQRIVREAGDMLGKDVVLVTEGEGTEVDKTLVERLAEPLTHMIRNAVDHGIETPDRRVADGKPAQGTIRLSAAHSSGDVLIEIADDGAGLNRPRILETAVRKGLVAADAKLADPEIDNLLFMAGFSTAEKVTNLSGRGVGMDVVKTAITSLGGRVSISSRPGKGTRFSIALPLTLAVMDGMVIHVEGETLVAPLSSVVETIRPKPSDLMPYGRDRHLLSIRGTYVPIVNLAHLLGFTSRRDVTADNILILIRSEHSGLVALAVDDISDQRQVVIKSLEGNYGAIEGISAATILGDGRIALIIDTDAILSLAGNIGRARPGTEEKAYAQTAAMG